MRKRLGIIGTLMLVFLIAVFVPAPSTSQARVTIAATVGPGFFAFDLMSGFASLISRNVSNVTTVVEQSPNFLDTMQRIAARRADLGIVGGVIVVDALLGEEAFRGNRVPVRTLALLHDFVSHLVTLEGTGITTIGDLRGKRIGIDGPGSVRDALRILQAAGIDPQREVRTEVAAAPGAWVAALREGRIDAVYAVSLGSPTVPDVVAMATAPCVRLRIIPLDSVLPALRRQYGDRYRSFTIKGGMYPGIAVDVPTISGSAQLVALANFDTALAYQITKVFYEKRAELAQFSSAALYITTIGLSERSPIPFHPGAAQYFRERGVPGF